MSTNNQCCVGATEGTYFGNGANGQLTKKKIKAVIFAPEYDATGVPNELDLTQADFGTYFKNLISTATTIDKRLMPTGILTDHTPSRSDYGSWTAPDGSKVIDRASGGIYSHLISWAGDKASFVKLQQAGKLSCGTRRVIEIDADRTIWVYQATPQSTVATGYPMNGDSVDSYFTYHGSPDPNMVSIGYDYNQEIDMGCSYGIPACDHGLSWSDLNALSAGYLSITSVVVASVVVDAFHHVGKARNNAAYTGLTTAANWIVTDLTDGSNLAATPTESPTGTYTLALVPSLTAAGSVKIEAVSPTYVFEAQTDDVP